MNDLIQPHNEPVAARWGAGGKSYDRVSYGIADSIEHALLRLAPSAGERVLDLATGTGWTARRLHQLGARVVAVDVAAGVVDAARMLSSPEIDFQVGDAEALRFPDGELDACISTCGIMFASRPEAAAKEVARVLKRGGRFVTTCWTPDSTVAAMFAIIKRYMKTPADPSSAPPSPFEWGKPERVRELLGTSFDLKLEKSVSTYREPNPEAAWEVFSRGYGPIKMLAEALPADRRSALREELIALHRQYMTDLGVQMPREYILVHGVRK